MEYLIAELIKAVLLMLAIIGICGTVLVLAAVSDRFFDIDPED